MKFCCGITLYNPKKNEIDNIYKYLSTFKRVYIYDNTVHSEINFSYLFESKSLKCLSRFSNDGLSIAYNRMCEDAKKEGYDYILLLDQDSEISQIDIENMIETIKNDENEDIAVYAPQIIYNHKKIGKIKHEVNRYTEIAWAISSGSIINLDLFSKIGNFDENYFIDRLDYDYCISAKKKGYRIVEIQGCYLRQELGEEKLFFGNSISVHNPTRNYYSFRNRFYYYLIKNKASLKNIFLVMVLSVRAIIYILLFESKKVENFKMIEKATKDFFMRKMGKSCFNNEKL